MKTILKLIIATLFIFLCLQMFPPILADEGKAVINNISYPSKVYDGEETSATISVTNMQIPNSAANFYIQIKLNGILVIDESSNPWQCLQGTTVSRQVLLPKMSGPSTNIFSVALYWRDQTSDLLEDEKSFTVVVVKLVVKEFVFNDVNLNIGEIGTESVSFRNGGNDIMYNTGLSFEGNLVKVEPSNLDIGELNPHQEYTTKVELEAYSTPGVEDLLVKITFSDFRGTRHEETYSIKIFVEKSQVHITLTAPNEAVYNSPSRFEIELIDSNGIPLKGETVYFKIDRDEIGSDITDEKGKVDADFIINVTAGPHKFTAYFLGSDILNPAEESVEFTVSPANTVLKIDTPAIIVVEKSFNLTAELLDGNGNPLSESLILFYLEDEKIGVTETDHNGIAKIAITPEKKGANRIKAEYEGSGSLEPSINETTINVKALESQLSFSPPRYALEGFGIRTPVFLQDPNGKGISHAKIKIEVTSSGKVIESKTLDTDEKGEAFVDVTTRYPGTLTLKISFEGGSKYEAIQGEYRVGIVSMMLVLLMLVSAAAVAILVTFFKLGWIQKFGSKISDASRSYGMMEEMKGYETCVSCGTAIPSSSKFCDRCGAIQDESQTDSIRVDIDEEVFNYIVGKGGEISVSQAAKDLGITKKQLMEAVERLKGAGRLE